MLAPLYWSGISLAWHTVIALKLWYSGLLSAPACSREARSTPRLPSMSTLGRGPWVAYTISQYITILLALQLTFVAALTGTGSTVGAAGYSLIAASLLVSGALIGLLLVDLVIPTFFWFAAGIGLTTALPLAIWFLWLKPL